jgi:hypothetical protein
MNEDTCTQYDDLSPEREWDEEELEDDKDHFENYEEPEGEENQDKGYGFCSDCGTPLENWGAASHGDGDIFDEIGCPQCEETKREIHASYCMCEDCYDRNL